MSHHTVSGVTTIAVFTVMRCATMWTIVEMEVMRKRKTVSKSQKGKGKSKGPKVSAVCKTYLWDFSLFCRGLSYTYDGRSLLTIVSPILKTHVSLRCNPSPLIPISFEGEIGKWRPPPWGMGSEGQSLQTPGLCSGRNTCVHCSALTLPPCLVSSSSEEETGIWPGFSAHFLLVKGGGPRAFEKSQSQCFGLFGHIFFLETAGFGSICFQSLIKVNNLTQCSFWDIVLESALFLCFVSLMHLCVSCLSVTFRPSRKVDRQSFHPTKRFYWPLCLKAF